MFRKRYTKTLAGASLFLVFLMLGISQAAEIVVNTDDTWSDDSGFSAGDTVVVNSVATLTVDGDAAGKKLASIALGQDSTSPAGSGIGTLTLTADGKLNTQALILGNENNGILNLASDSVLSVTGITFNRGTIANEGSQNWSSKTITWNNTNPIVFSGGGTINLGANATGQSLILLDGTLTTSGDLNANNFTLTGGTLQTAGELTFDQLLTAGGGAIELKSGSTWTLDQNQSAGTIIVSGGTATLGMDHNFQTGGGTISMSSGIINMGSYDLNLGTANITGGSITSGTLGGSTVTWNTGTVTASVYSFFNEGYYIDDSNVSMGGDAVLYVPYNYIYPQNSYTVTYDFTLADTATVIGAGTILYVQADGNIVSTGGTNTADMIFLGRNNQSIFFDSGATFNGNIDIANGISNEIRNGIFNGMVTISNPGDSGTGTGSIVPVGVGVTEIIGGTFNNLVIFDLYKRTDITNDTENKATVTGGTFNGSATSDGMLITGNANALISGGVFNNTLSISGSGTTTLAGGTIDSIALVDDSRTSGVTASTSTLLITQDRTVNGAYGVLVQSGTLNIQSGVTLTLAAGEITMQSGVNSGGTLTGEGTVAGNVNFDTGGKLDGNLTITGNLTLDKATIDFDPNEPRDTTTVQGQTTLENGGTLTVMPSTTPVANGSQQTVIQSAGGFVDQGFSVESGTPGFYALGEIVGNDYIVTIGKNINTFPAGAKNANRVRTYLYDLYYDGDLQSEVMAAVQSDSNQQMAAEKLAGESHMSGMQNLMNSGIIRMHTLTNKIRPNMDSRFFEMGMANNGEATIRAQFDPHAEFERTSVWYAGYGMGGHIVGNENTASTELSCSGMMVGIEGIYGSGSKKVGFFYDRSYAGTDVNALQARNDIDTNFFGAYHSSEMENGYRLMTLGFGEDRYRSRRNMVLGSGSSALSEIAQAGYHGWQTTFYVERGYELQGDLNRLQPFVSMQYSYIRRNGFEETGAQYTGLDIGAESYDSLRGYLGARWDTPFLEIGHDRRTGLSLGGFVQLQTAWIHEMLNKTAPISNAHLGASTLSSNFLVEGADCGRDWWLFSVGTKWRLAKAFSLYGDYTLLLNGRESLHTGSGGLSLSW